MKWVFGKEKKTNVVTKVETTMIDDCHYIHKAELDFSPKLNLIQKFISAKISYLVESSSSFSSVKSFVHRNPSNSTFRLSSAVTSDNQYGDKFYRHFLNHFSDSYPLLNSHINVGDFVDRGYLIREFKNYFWLPLGI